MDNYKEMIEEKRIAIDNDQYHLWQKKYLGVSTLDKLMDTLNNDTLYKTFLSKNGLSYEKKAAKPDHSKNNR